MYIASLPNNPACQYCVKIIAGPIVRKKGNILNFFFIPKYISVPEINIIAGNDNI